MKSIMILAVVLLSAFSMAQAQALTKLDCNSQVADIPKSWLDMTGGCISEMKRQIKMEIEASMTYLAMGAHFSQDTVNREGFAKFFFNSAAEEREHGMKLIEYLLMRGQLTGIDKEITDLIRYDAPGKVIWGSGVEAMKDALRTEAKVTKSIRRVIEVCEKDKSFNDYHLVDYLTGTYLEEQYHGQRDLAGKISTLDKMVESQGTIGEFLYDKKLLG